MKESDPRKPSEPGPVEIIWLPPAFDLDIFPSEQAATPSPFASAEGSAAPSQSGAREQASTPAPISTLPRAATQSPIRAFEVASAVSPVRAFESASTTLPFRAHDQSASRLPLSCVLSEDVALEWHEAVAIVQELADHITHGVRGEPSGSVPDIEDIDLEATGHIRARLDPAGWEPAVRGLGYLIQQLFVDRKGWGNLDLIVSQVISVTPTIRTVADLTRELTRWERPFPPRLEKLRQVYERARRAVENNPAILLPRERDAPPAPETSSDLPLTPTLQAESPRTVWQVMWSLRSSRQRVAILAATVAAAFVAFIPVARLAFSGRQEAALITPQRVSEAQPPAIGSAQVVDSVPPIQGAPIERARPVDNPRQLPAATAASARPSISGPSLPVSPLSRSAVTRAPIPELAPKPSTPLQTGPPPFAVDRPKPGVGFPAISGLVAVPGGVPLVTAGAAVPRTAPEPVPPADTARRLPARVAGEPVYTTGDPGVTEPVLIRPYVPEGPLPGTSEQRPGILEIIVDTRGLVESVRLRSSANRYRERWWVFTAKNWQFTPALKDGHPVKFLKRIAIPDTGPPDPE